jgi:nucleotidyltransferase
MNTRRIGKITSVDSFRILVELDDNLKSLFKSGFNDIYEIARINSYIIVPVGSDRIVAIVTRVKVQDETEIERNHGAITLPKSKRYLVATMIGTIQGNNTYLQGVYNYPILDNPVWYVVKDDLDKIFDTKEDSDTIDFEKDYFLPIGTSPAFSDYKIKINPDRFFGKHAAILGNTGSGKSCTVSSIIQTLFRFLFPVQEKDENGENELRTKNLENAHFIIFDTNGEYKKAFGFDENNPYAEKSIVNSFYIDKDGMKIPYWFMNFDDFDYLFEPSSGTQVPLLKSALGLAKERTEESIMQGIDSYIEKGIMSLLDASPDDIKKKKCKSEYGNWNWQQNNQIKQLSDTISITDGVLGEIKTILLRISHNNTITEETKAIRELRTKYEDYLTSKNSKKVIQEKNIDLPIHFSFKELLSRHFDDAIEQSEQSNNKLREYASTLKLRMQSYFNDERISSPLLLKHEEKIENGLAKFLAFILGDFYKVFSPEDNDLFSEYYKKIFPALKEGNTNQITIIDMSLLPYEVLETITGLVGRLILEFTSRISPRGSFPIVIVLEEAQNYIPEINRKDRTSISKKVFERIAREGRKYGISLIVSSQRPSELSKTVLSQCNSFVIHRLQNPEDQKYVKQLVSAANEDILAQLPILPQQHAIIMGDAVRTPIQVRLNNANPKPDSENPKFISKWLRKSNINTPDYKSIATEWECVSNEQTCNNIEQTTQLIVEN